MDNKYENFKYFIECYFNWSMDYIDLKKLILDYIDREMKEYVEGLQKEINDLYNLNDSSLVKNLVFMFGRRNLSIEKANDMIKLLYDEMNNMDKIKKTK